MFAYLYLRKSAKFGFKKVKLNLGICLQICQISATFAGGFGRLAGVLKQYYSRQRAMPIRNRNHPNNRNNNLGFRLLFSCRLSIVTACSGHSGVLLRIAAGGAMLIASLSQPGSRRFALRSNSETFPHPVLIGTVRGFFEENPPSVPPFAKGGSEERSWACVKTYLDVDRIGEWNS